jgi:hypothetical protein
VKDAEKIRALAAFLKGWLPLWETKGGRWRLVFLSPSLIQLYRDLSKPVDSPGIHT